MNEPYTTPQVADIVGISQRKLLSYIEREYVAPSVLEASGHGSKRLWSYNDLVRCATIKLLSGFLSVKTIRYVTKPMLDDRTIATDSVWVVTEMFGNQEVVFSTEPLGGFEEELLSEQWRRQHPVNLIVYFKDIHTWVESRLARNLS